MFVEESCGVVATGLHVARVMHLYFGRIETGRYVGPRNSFWLVPRSTEEDASPSVGFLVSLKVLVDEACKLRNNMIADFGGVLIAHYIF